jgi:peptide/nickel transport system ATP-binding protein
MATNGDAAHLRDSSLLRVEHLVVEYGRTNARVQAVSNVSVDVLRGETLGLVGETGCGKSSLARAVMQLPPPLSGSVVVGGKDLVPLSGEELRRARRPLQMIFQNPISSLNPLRKVRDIVVEGLAMRGADGATKASRAATVLAEVGLDIDAMGHRRPRELSGGQCQRLCIARVLALEPELVICDEPVSALDVSVQAQVLALLDEMKRRHALSLVFIAHDLAVVRNVSDRVAVMYLGKLCEVGSANDVYERPLHHYTRALLDAIPQPDPGLRPGDSELPGEPPSPIDPPSGCRFRLRCARADDRCAQDEPMMRPIDRDHFVACHHPLEPITAPVAQPAAGRRDQAAPPQEVPPDDQRQ